MTKTTGQDPSQPTHRFCVAPMIDWTDRYCRYFHRQLTHHARLYTEMVVDQALLHGDVERLAGFDVTERPVALQLGGSTPRHLAAAARIGEQLGYCEINLNVGCPSDRVQSGTFGACLMRTPDVVASCVEAMAAAVSVPVTVKCRIGVDDQDPTSVLPDFVERITKVGVETIIVHARKAWLNGLSPKENRSVPPLDYPLVAAVKRAFPDTSFILNGGIVDLATTALHLETFDGVMLGRAAYENPYLLAKVDQQIFGDASTPPSRLDVVKQTAQHFDAQSVPLWRYARHMLGLFHGQKGARYWRRMISEEGRDPGHDGAWLIQLAEQVCEQNLEAEMPS